MSLYKVKMQHSAESFEALAHMQYDLFCTRNLFFRTVIGAAAIVAGAAYMPEWWSFLLVAYGAYLLTSRYASANSTAHKLSKTIEDSGMPYPCSRLEFGQDAMSIVSLPDNEPICDPIEYYRLRGIGEDRSYLYLFRDEHGGFMVPKKALGEKTQEFKTFIEDKTHKSFKRRSAPYKELMRRLKDRRSEPYHL